MIYSLTVSLMARAQTILIQIRRTLRNLRGDFTGLQDKLKFIGEMGYTIVSIGPIFSTEKYDGSMPTSYTTIERHFGTTEEFQSTVEAYKAKNMSIMVDFPLTNVSPNHEWAKDASKADWIASTNNGQVQWDLSNKDARSTYSSSN